ncbi:MAG: DUF6782 family putative metallopeptidase [Polyangiaceae bacterium]
MLGAVAMATALVLGGCGGGRTGDANHAATTSSASASSSAESARDVATKTPEPTMDPVVLAELERVSEFRGLPIKHHFKTVRLDRAAVLERTKTKMNEELPADVLDWVAESLRALELLPIDYDLTEGFLELVTGRIAGFYDPDDKTMVLLDDLEDSQEEETLAHELVHALQDQSFDLGAMLDYKQGHGDESAAMQHLVEGDATLAGMQLANGPDFAPSIEQMRRAFYTSTKLSQIGVGTPDILIATLVSPYIDGYEFARQLQARSGWAGVNKAFERLPTTTEQVLHLDKYDAREAALVVPPISPAALGAGFVVKLEDSNGELGLKLMLEQWAARKTAAQAAAGWGGDRFAVAVRDKGPAGREVAVAYYTRMDTTLDADELTAVLTSEFGTKCTERSDLGPLAWRRKDRDVVLVAGPYRQPGGVAGRITLSAGDCSTATAWLDALLK